MDYTDILLPIRKVVRAINLDSKRIEKSCGLSIPQVLALTFLSRCDGYQATQLQLRNYLSLNSSTVTGIVSRLIKKGFVAKLPRKEDKRAVQLILTDSGMQVLDKTPALFQERLLKRVAELPVGQAEAMQTGLELLLKVVSSVESPEQGDSDNVAELPIL